MNTFISRGGGCGVACYVVGENSVISCSAWGLRGCSDGLKGGTAEPERLFLSCDDCYNLSNLQTRRCRYFARSSHLIFTCQTNVL